jgi:hypothetical protein
MACGTRSSTKPTYSPVLEPNSVVLLYIVLEPTPKEGSIIVDLDPPKEAPAVLATPI